MYVQLEHNIHLFPLITPNAVLWDQQNVLLYMHWKAYTDWQNVCDVDMNAKFQTFIPPSLGV